VWVVSTGAELQPTNSVPDALWEMCPLDPKAAVSLLSRILTQKRVVGGDRDRGKKEVALLQIVSAATDSLLGQQTTGLGH